MRTTLAGLAADDRHGEFCIIGSGPAGLTIASELARAGREVVLLEAGGEAWSDRSQDVYRGEVVGDPYFPLETVRLRYLGGTSNHWAGWCRPLDALDFAFKPEFPTAHWPIAKSDLDPYLAPAEAILALPPLPADEVVDPAIGVRRVHFYFSPPVRFWPAFGPTLEAAANVRVVTDANVTLLATDGGRVTRVEARDFDGNVRAIRADTYVLAAGGIENSRLLLWSDEVQNGALISPGAPLGRFWMEHPHQTIGGGIVPRFYAEAAPFAQRLFFSLTEATQRELGVLNCGLRVEPMRREELRSLVDDLACAAPQLARWAARDLAANRSCGALLRAAWEQEPIAENRITLAPDAVDGFGMPRVRLYWTRTQRDLSTVRDSAITFARHLAENGLGRVRLEPWVLDLEAPETGELAGKHHMGGTRMAASPRDGVVDRHCRVFGQSNLFVAGSSVFPSTGHANPTLTIVQLALRLADRLASGG